ncbi:MAG: dihydrolipoyl dehydrogenase [Verrucomicrobiota bacterium]
MGKAQFDFDVAIIGGGSGGYAAARTVADGGLKAVLIEGGEEIGGLCILRGCMPTKALLHAAEKLHHAKSGRSWGIHSEVKKFDFAAAMARKDFIIEDFAKYRREGIARGKFKFIRALARFLNPHTVELSTGEKITARNFVIATGSKVAPPPLPQLTEAGYLTSDDALKLATLPDSLIVLGGGAIGCEFAQLFARFGTKITLVQRSPRVLHDFDADAAAVVEEVFRREGIDVFTGTQLLSAKREGDKKTVTFSHGKKVVSVSAQNILYALGRTPQTDGLGLENAEVELRRGRIVCDEYMRTSSPHIFAAGDCTGPHDIVHVAVQQGEIAGQNILRPGTRKLDNRLHMGVVFTEPQVAFVGLSEKAAAARNIPVIAASYPFNDHGKSIIMEAMDGFVKLLADPATGEILGGACTGPAGGELIHEIVVAMARRMTVQELTALPHYHPTLAEIWTYPAEDLAAQVATR